MVRIALGFEPFASHRDNYRLQGQDFTEEMQAYWMEQGISLLNSAKLVLCKKRLEDRSVLSRYVGGNRRLHAKIFIGDQAATLGSSNFTISGLKSNLEANARFSRSRDKARYEETVDIAENYWHLGRDYNDELIALLDMLLQVVSWQEALARACAELLEGDWAARYIRESQLSSNSNLWPAQKQGIAQALYILSRQDSVTDLDIYSHGVLSHTKSQSHELMLSALRRAQVLCVDEGHNFLNVKSNRTKEILRNMADHVLLFTATPINWGVVDLLRIVDMLGADNLEDGTLEMFKKLLGKQSIRHSFTELEARQLRAEIRRFTVRRTKRMLNALIDREPDKYTDYRGVKCRFPKHKPEIYELNEPKTDRLIAGEIKKLAGQLTGVTHFTKTLEMPEILRKQGRTDENYLAQRLVSAKHLARYMIMAALRSSRLALAEHIAGTDTAVKYFKLSDFSKSSPTGNMIERLYEISGKPPKIKLNVEVPDWDEVAARWLDIIRPIWYEELTQPRSKPLLLKDIRKKLILAKDSLQPEIIEHFKSFPVQKQTDKRILACIIGVS